MPGPLSLLPVLIPNGCVAKKSVPTAAVDNSAAVIPTTAAPPAEAEAAPATTPGLGTKTASTLLLYDAQISAGFSDAMRMYAAYTLGGVSSSGFRGVDDLVGQLKEYATIERLVIFTHGVSGMLGFVDEEADLYQMLFEDVGGVVSDGNAEPPMVYLTLENITSLFSGVAPQVTGSLDIDGCNVANWPSQMEKFRSLFRAPAITGWNFYHLLNPVTLNLTGQESAETITSQVNIPTVYLASGAPDLSGFAGQAGQFSTLYEWFRDVLESNPPGISADPKTYIPRADADTLELESSAAAGMVDLISPDLPVITRLTRVTIRVP